MPILIRRVKTLPLTTASQAQLIVIHILSRLKEIHRKMNKNLKRDEDVVGVKESGKPFGNVHSQLTTRKLGYGSIFFSRGQKISRIKNIYRCDYIINAADGISG